MIAERFPEIQALSMEEKRDLLSDLCSEIAMRNHDSEDAEVVRVLEERWRAHCSDPSGAVTLEEFRERVGLRK